MPPDKEEKSDDSSPFPKIEPWPAQVLGPELMTELVAQLRRYIVADEHQLTAIALWTIFTHSHDCFDHSPILAVTAPTIRSGKTSVLNVIGRLVSRPLPSSNVTTAIFRAIDLFSPTLIADEADTYLSDNKNLIGVLNSGFDRHSARIGRNVGENYTKFRNFSTWCPKAIGAVGRLPPSLADRSIEIRLQRKRSDEAVERLSIHRLEELTSLARKIIRWSADHHEYLGRDEPPFPSNLADREADKWRPLLSIAAALGEHWLRKAHEAATHLSNLDDPAERLSDAERLIRDMAAVFEAKPNADWLATEALATALAQLPDSHWSGRQSSGFAKFMALTLKPFRLRPRQKNLGANKVLRGYFRADVLDMAARYGRPAAGESPASTRATSDTAATAATAATRASSEEAVSANASSLGSEANNKSIVVQNDSGSSANSVPTPADDPCDLPLFGGQLDGEQPGTLQ